VPIVKFLPFQSFTRPGLVVAVIMLGTAAAQESAPSAERGKSLYMAAGCMHCHGSVGQGGAAGRRLAPKPLPAAAIAQFIRSNGTTMPAYSETLLNDAAVADIAAYLVGISATQQADDIAALRNLKIERKANP
jgi:mono/diheme cytochrome c family protein